jgi:hypothetical protein
MVVSPCLRPKGSGAALTPPQEKVIIIMSAHKNTVLEDIVVDTIPVGRSDANINLFHPSRHICLLNQWYSTFFVRVHPDIISLQLYTSKVVDV